MTRLNDLPERYRRAAEKHGLGATGKFPHATIRPDDEGELNFGKSVSWLAMRPAEARAFAQILVEKADVAENRT